MPKHDFRVIQGCPVGKNLAPYIAILANDAHATIDSIYRGDDARAILNAHGKHSQYQLYHATPTQRIQWGISGTPNEPGFSTHEQKSDGVAYPNVPRGGNLLWWQVGFDVADSDVDRVIWQAGTHHWDLWRPYGAGVEHHHVNFRSEPHPTPATFIRIQRLRMTLPRT